MDGTGLCSFNETHSSFSQSERTYGVLKQEVRDLRDIMDDVVTLEREEEALAGVVGERRRRRGGHRLVAGIPAPVATGGAAVAG